MHFRMGPTGQIIRGHVLDVSEKPFQRVLQDYDSQLYIKWNPNKLKGWGCWEIRRRPNQKRVKAVEKYGEASIVVIDYVEWDIENHILDLPYLNYLGVERLKAMDTWNEGQKHFVDRLEAKEADHRAEVERKRRDDMRYAAKQYKTEIKAFKDMIQSGLNPNRLADVWSKAKI